MIQVPESVLRRNDQRKQEEVMKRRDDVPGQLDVFRETFREKQIEIEALINSLEPIADRNKLSEQFNQISKELCLLNKYLSASSIFLVPYDQKISRNTLQELQEKSFTLEKKLLPKKKFGFTSRKDVKTKDETDKGDRKDTSKLAFNDTDISKYSERALLLCGFSDKSNETLVLCESQIENKDITITRLSNCTVFIHGSPNTLHLSSIRKCKVLSGPIRTSIFIDNCEDSTLAFPCQQLRIHNTERSDFYIHVTTKAIIEDSKHVRFAPYSYSYKEIDYHYELSGLDRSINNWNQIDDFNWLVHNKQSPNWSEVPEDERVELND